MAYKNPERFPALDPDGEVPRGTGTASPTRLLDAQEHALLFSCLSDIRLPADAFMDIWSGVERVLAQSVKADGRKMFHWVRLVHGRNLYVCPASSSEQVRVGCFFRTKDSRAVRFEMNPRVFAR